LDWQLKFIRFLMGELLMEKMTIQFLRGFKEIESTSTKVLADGLVNALNSIPDKEIICKEYSPNFDLPKWLQNKMGNRFVRFILYPLLPPKGKSIIVHLLDHGYSHLLYLRPKNTIIVTVTDIMPILWWKGLFPNQSRKKFPVTVMYSLNALKRAKHIISISSQTKKDLINYLGFDANKITAIHLGVDKIFRQYDKKVKKEMRNELFGPDLKKLILITGSGFYKNHETSLKVISLLIDNGNENIYLVKSGGKSKSWINLLKKYNLDHRVIYIDFLPREKMTDLYNSVDILMFPSLYEGFGWPPLEAMACGTPVITSNSGSLPEIMGSLVLNCDPEDTKCLSQILQKILNDVYYREDVIKQGLIQANKFNWENTANKMTEVYDLLENSE
jgi:glycosyltransferase involved in cell wall biosynthesis